MIKHGGSGVVYLNWSWFSIDTSSINYLSGNSFLYLSRQVLYKSGQIFSKKQQQTIPSYTEQFHDGGPRFDKCIRYFIDLLNCVTTEINFQNVRALVRKILHYSRFEAYGILFYLSHQCISWVRIWIQFDISIFSFIMSTTRVTQGLGTSLLVAIASPTFPNNALKRLSGNADN